MKECGKNLIHVNWYPIEIIGVVRNHNFTDKFNITNKKKMKFDLSPNC